MVTDLRPRLLPFASLFLLLAIGSLFQPAGFRGLDEVSLAGLPLSTIQNALVLGAAVLAAFSFGVHRWLNPVCAAAALMLLMTFTLSTRLDWLTPTQSIRTFFAFALAPFVYEVRLPMSLRNRLQTLLPCFAIMNLALAIILYVMVGRLPIRIDWGAIRLAGTVVPAGMAMLGLVALIFSLLAARPDSKMVWLGAVNYLIVVWTGTRSAIISGAMFCFAWILAEWMRRDRRSTFRQRLGLGLLVPLAIGSYLPFIAERMSGFWSGKEEAVVLSMPSDESGFGFEFGAADADKGQSAEAQEGPNSASTVEDGAEIRLTMTGRVSAWKHYFQLAQENLWFGRGLGAGVVGSTGVLGRAFKLPHNEYLRLLVDGGLVGLTAMLATYLWILFGLFRQLSPPSRLLLATAALLLALEAVLTNVLANQSFVVPFWLYLAALREDRAAAEFQTP